MNGHELVWGLPVIGYLFLAGLGAGAMTISASLVLRGGPQGVHFTFARWGAFISAPAVILGTLLLVFELGSFEAGHWFRWINLFKTINLSPMSIGSWLLVIFVIHSLVYAYTFLSPLSGPGDKQDHLRRQLAWTGVPLGVSVAIYTGVLLGAMAARPFWNSPILALLFLVSAISTGIAAVLLAHALIHQRKGMDEPTIKRAHETGYLLNSSDTVLIGFEFIVIFLFIMYAHLTVGSVKEAISVIEFGGVLAPMFWFWVVIVGLLIPVAIELYYIIPRLIHHREFEPHASINYVVPIAVLIGGFMLRYVIVIAGQITFPIGL